MITPDEKIKLENRLKACETVKDIFDVVEHMYDIKSCKLGVLTKPEFIKGIIKAINLTNPKRRNV